MATLVKRIAINDLRFYMSKKAEKGQYLDYPNVHIVSNKTLHKQEKTW